MALLVLVHAGPCRRAGAVRARENSCLCRKSPLRFLEAADALRLLQTRRALHPLGLRRRRLSGHHAAQRVDGRPPRHGMPRQVVPLILPSDLHDFPLGASVFRVRLVRRHLRVHP